MDWYDLGIRVADSEALAMAKTLGFSGVGILIPWEKGVFETINGLKKTYPLDVAFGIVLKKKVKPQAKDIRRNVELIAATGEDREAVETPEVDIVFPEQLNYIMVKLAKKNNVAIGFDFSPVLHSSKKGRGEVLSHYFQISQLVRKYHAPFILTSGALSPWDLRSPSDLVAFGKILGFNEKESKKGLSGGIIKENRKRLGKEWLMPGVEIE